MSGEHVVRRSEAPEEPRPARGYSWPPFQPGHELSVRHGAYAEVRLGTRVAELAEQVRELVPGYIPADEIAVRGLCLTLARLEQTAAAFENGLKPGELDRLRHDERGWVNTARRYLNDLGLTPQSRAKLGLNLALGKDVARRALEQHVAANYAGGEEASAR